MKQTFLTVLISLVTVTGFAQVHWSPNADSVLNCDLFKSGEFMNMQTAESPMSGYLLIREGDFITEIINDGQYLLKSKIEFTSPCSYTSTVVEVTIPNYAMGVGTVIHTEIIATNTVMRILEIKSTYKGEDFIFVLKRVEGKTK